jgi:hypothetical protein
MVAVERIGPALAAGAAAVLLGCGCGCGGSGSGLRGRSTQPRDPLLQLAQCMRAHGLPHFPDPTPGGGLVIPNGIEVKAPAFQAAQRACSKLMPGVGPPSRPSAGARREMLRLARCIRAHGLPGFADPTTAPPALPPAGALAFGSGGMFLVVRDPHAPAFRRAAAACGFPLPH